MVRTSPVGLMSHHFSEILNNVNFDIFYHAPALILICTTAEIPWAVEDCSLAAENLMLTARGAGLGTCWIGFAQCAASLEAHINIRAEQALNGKDFEEFDKLAITGKWLFYPILISVGRFEPGKKPFQEFQLLIKRRNALVHYKVRRAKTKHPYEMPSLIDELGLRAAASNESLTAVSSMVSRLAKMENRTIPDWIDSDWCSAFETR